MLEDVIGQGDLKKSVEVAVVAARQRREPLGHILVAGQGGLGKTHILKSICRELGYHEAITQGNRLTPKKVRDFLMEHCCQGAGPSFLMIDEIHEMSDDAQEELYWPMDQGKILTLKEPILLSPFTLAGATTNLQELNGKSLVNRFVHFWELKELSVIDLMLMIGEWLLKNGMSIEWEETKQIARRSRGIPRLALKYARRARDFAQYNGRNEVLMVDLHKMFAEVGVDAVGIDKTQRRYLRLLKRLDKPVGKDALANMMGEMTAEQMTKLVEPYLWRVGFISSSSKGRELTGRGLQYLG